MKKLIASIYISLDGIVEAPENWYIPYADDEAEGYARQQLFASDSLLLGRRTYEGFAAAWPSRPDNDGGFAARINSMPKHVVTRSLTQDKAEWNATIIADDMPAEVRRLKKQPGKDILLYGSGSLVDALVDHDLIDELRLWIIPVVVGNGKRLFSDRKVMKSWQLVGTTPFRSGAVVLAYVPIKSPVGGVLT
ncbi:MAG TPA: dihydrofolate reductase family protein [Jatrophihabitantaceae bacterium]|nr:dihydrofolate reductase family protein [Jatrophihabitantaceae bacterium]